MISPKGLPVLAALMLGACAGLTTAEDRQAVTAEISHRLNLAAPQETVAALVADGLTADRAVQLALMNNPGLLAVYEEIGISAADVSKAGRLPNPVIAGAVRFGETRPEIDLDFALQFLNILTLPAQKSLAKIGHEERIQHVTARALAVARETRSAFLHFQAATRKQEALKRDQEAAEAGYRLAGRLRDAGNISELQLSLEQSAFEEARFRYAAGIRDMTATRERVTVLLGLWGENTGWSAATALPELPAADPALENLEALALENRPELMAARRSFDRMAKARDLAYKLRWFGNVEAGVSAERGDEWTIGPAVTLELPLFDQHQADLARSDAEVRQSLHRLSEIAVQIRSDVRLGREQLIMARRTAEHYLGETLPLKARIVQLTLQQYNYMLMGAPDVLLARREMIAAELAAIDAVHDYWVARSDLEFATGGRLSLSSLSNPVNHGE